MVFAQNNNLIKELIDDLINLEIREILRAIHEPVFIDILINWMFINKFVLWIKYIRIRLVNCLANIVAFLFYFFFFKLSFKAVMFVNYFHVDILLFLSIEYGNWFIKYLFYIICCWQIWLLTFAFANCRCISYIPKHFLLILLFQCIFIKFIITVRFRMQSKNFDFLKLFF